MKPGEFKEFIKKSFENNRHQAIFCTGSVGIGKSACIRQAAKELDYELRDIRLSLLDAVDLRGLPAIKKNETVWTRPTFLPSEDCYDNIVLFFDEFSNAPPAIQNACLQLVLDRKLGEYSLPDNVRVICAGNTIDDGAHVFKLSSALCNRFINIRFEADFDDWREWAYDNGINKMIISFLEFRMDLLHSYGKEAAFATPRTWEFVSRLMDMGLPRHILEEVICGTVGNGAGMEFISYIASNEQLPKAEEILFNNNDVIPKESSQLHALISSLALLVQKHMEKSERAIEYAMKLPKEFSVLLVKELYKVDPRITKCVAYASWIKENREAMV